MRICGDPRIPALALIKSSLLSLGALPGRAASEREMCGEMTSDLSTATTLSITDRGGQWIRLRLPSKRQHRVHVQTASTHCRPTLGLNCTKQCAGSHRAPIQSSFALDTQEIPRFKVTRRRFKTWLRYRNEWYWNGPGSYVGTEATASAQHIISQKGSTMPGMSCPWTGLELENRIFFFAL